MPSNGPANLHVEVDEATARGAYSNLAMISHTETEFILDFTFLQPGAPKAKVHSRIVTSPVHAKRLAVALQNNIRAYEERFGKLKVEPPKP